MHEATGKRYTAEARRTGPCLAPRDRPGPSGTMPTSAGRPGGGVLASGTANRRPQTADRRGR